jgi:hypothetical protein
MEYKINPNAVNQFLMGADIYVEGEPVDTIGMIVKGRVMMQNSGAKIIMSSGSFVGIQDLYVGKYQNTYSACDDVMLYVFPVNRVEELDTILSFNKDYHGFMVASLYKIIYELDQVYQGLLKICPELHQFITGTYNDLLASATQRGYKIKSSERMASLRMPEHSLEHLEDRIDYYCECRNVPMDAVKIFYSYGNTITLYQIEEQVDIVNQLTEAIRQLAAEFISIANCLVDDTEQCLFHLITRLSKLTDNISGMELLDIMDNIIEKVNKAENFAEKMLGSEYTVDREKMEEGYHLLLTGNMTNSVNEGPINKYSNEEAKNALSECKDAYTKILDYAGIDSVRALEMKSVMADFVHMRDKHSTEDFARSVRRKIAENHYIVYKEAFLRAYAEKEQPRIIEMFLKYGFADDSLLTNEQMLSLYFLRVENNQEEHCRVYDIVSWLTMIYEGKKEPSKNEFDMEYPEMVAGLKRQGKLNEKEAISWLSDTARKLEYEIQNMFRYNNRTTSGQISSFVPIMYGDQYPENIEKILNSSAKVNAAVEKLMKIDYSVFDREVLYVNKEKNIAKEYIIKRVYPDFILMPTVGTNGVMWQEISGKKRDTAGRLLLPVFTDMDINNILVKILGRFRWELCRTIEGPAWNDITSKSLTSEYADYLQFYRKNKELSEEKKEKIKQQIQKGRNNSREIFVLDFENWINYESKGAVKLNKIVREIMATYCPFGKELRDQLKNQPVFEEATARYFREKLKKIREIEGRYRMLQKDSIELTPELVETLEYYKEQ